MMNKCIYNLVAFALIALNTTANANEAMVLNRSITEKPVIKALHMKMEHCSQVAAASGTSIQDDCLEVQAQLVEAFGSFEAYWMAHYNDPTVVHPVDANFGFDSQMKLSTD